MNWDKKRSKVKYCKLKYITQESIWSWFGLKVTERGKEVGECWPDKFLKVMIDGARLEFGRENTSGFLCVCVSVLQDDALVLVLYDV